MTGIGTGTLLLLWLIVPVVIVYVASMVWHPCFRYRYMLYSSLPVCILAGAAMSKDEPRRVAPTAQK